MKKYIFLVSIFLWTLFNCKSNDSDTKIVQNVETKNEVIATENKNVGNKDTLTSNKEDTNIPINLVNLPFDFEEKNKLANQNEAKFKEVYPTLKEEKFESIKKIIYENNEDNPDQIFQINNGGLSFDTYVYCTYGDSDSQTLININNNKIISSESIGYAMPENETYQSFVINKDISVIVYDINYNTRSKKSIEKYQIKKDGLIIKLK
ncbi:MULTISPECIES: hypothetical protein [Flavobacterium]|uniref:Beta-lactamase-inhibitor-like PepSY-like domain-containing protein n=1 Tax=Flavobacterium hankyongi TaxID=1176532 RepID=A0ABP8ZK36_9FLAO|nr:hypothetical protein [Flavobacterium sp. N1846]